MMAKFKKKGNVVLLTLISLALIAVTLILTRENKVDISHQDLNDFNQLERELEARIREKNKTLEENLRLLLEEQGEDYYEEIKIFGELDQSEITPDGSIFFFLTSGAIDLSSSESCSVESATRLHPGKKVFVLFITPNITEVLDSNTLSVLLNFENIFFRYIQISTFMEQNKHLEQWFTESKFQLVPDQIPGHLANVLTYIFLYRFGGIVLSFDLLLRKPIGSLGSFASKCPEEDSTNLLAISLPKKHQLMAEAMENLMKYHFSSDATSTGSKLLTDRIRLGCEVSFMAELKFKECKLLSGVKLVDTLCPVPRYKYETIYDPARAKLLAKRTEEYHGLNLWRENAAEIEVWGGEDSRSFYFNVASEVCPLTSQVLGKDKIFGP